MPEVKKSLLDAIKVFAKENKEVIALAGTVGTWVGIAWSIYSSAADQKHREEQTNRMIAAIRELHHRFDEIKQQLDAKTQEIITSANDLYTKQSMSKSDAAITAMRLLPGGREIEELRQFIDSNRQVASVAFSELFRFIQADASTSEQDATDNYMKIIFGLGEFLYVLDVLLKIDKYYFNSLNVIDTQLYDWRSNESLTEDPPSEAEKVLLSISKLLVVVEAVARARFGKFELEFDSYEVCDNPDPRYAQYCEYYQEYWASYKFDGKNVTLDHASYRPGFEQFSVDDFTNAARAKYDTALNDEVRSVRQPFLSLADSMKMYLIELSYVFTFGETFKFTNDYPSEERKSVYVNLKTRLDQLMGPIENQLTLEKLRTSIEILRTEIVTSQYAMDYIKQVVQNRFGKSLTDVEAKVFSIKLKQLGGKEFNEWLSKLSPEQFNIFVTHRSVLIKFHGDLKLEGATLPTRYTGSLLPHAVFITKRNTVSTINETADTEIPTQETTVKIDSTVIQHLVKEGFLRSRRLQSDNMQPLNASVNRDIDDDLEDASLDQESQAQDYANP